MEEFMNNVVVEEKEEEDADDPSILEHIIPRIPNPSLDPTQQVDIIVYIMAHEVNVTICVGNMP